MTTSDNHSGSDTNAAKTLRGGELRRRTLAGLAGVWLCLHFLGATALGASVYWDINGAGTGAGGTTPSGTWDAVTANWNNSSGGGTPFTWTNGNTAFFSAGSDATGLFTVTLSGAQTAVGLTIEEGTVTLQGDGLTLSSSMITANVSTKAIITAIVSGSAGLTKAGSGELVLDAANDFTGNLSLQRGTLTLDNDSAASSGTINMSNGGGAVLLRSTKSVTLANAINLGTSNGNPLEFAADSGKQLTLNGVISGAHSWSANGAGMIILGGAADNTFPGAVTVAQGTLVVAKNKALGSTLNGTTVNSGTTLGFQGDFEYTENEVLTINGAGVGGVGAINNLSGDNLFDGTVTLASASTIGAASGFLGFVGPVSGSYALTKVGAGQIDLYGENNNYTTALISEGTLGVWWPVNAGTGLATVSAGASLLGNGSVPGGIDLSGTLSPGASPDQLDSGSQTWNAGANYVWELDFAGGDAGVNWDLLNITGGLTLSPMAAGGFTLNIVSLDLNDDAGDVADFDNTQEYNWTIATTTTGLSGFDAAKFTLAGSSFSNDKGGGKFVIRQSGNDLVLRFDPAPVITCPANIAQANDPGVCGASIPFAATATDNDTVTPPVLTYKIGSTPITSPHLFPVGMTTVDATATDSVGNTDTCSFTVTVTDAQAPAITGTPANITVQTGAGRTTCDQVATWTAPTASDNCGVTSFTSDHNSGDTFPVGTTTVTYTAKDAADNTTTGSFTVTVQDNTVPVAVAKNITRSLALNGTVSITAADVDNASSDNCHIASLSVAPNTWSCSVGDKAVTLTVTDDAGNVSTAAATVTITTPSYAPAPHYGQPDVALANPKTDTITDVTLNVGQNLSNSLAKTIGIGVAAGFQFGEPVGVGAGVEVGYGGYPGNTNRFRVRTTAAQNEWEIYDTQNSAVAMFVHVVPDTSLTVEVNPATMPGCLEQYTWDLAVTIRGSIPQGTIFKTASVCGAHTFPMTFTSYFDQVVSRTGSVTLDDGTAPVALCQPKTLALDSTGHATLNASDIDNSSTDNCTTAASLVKELSKDGLTSWATSLTYDCGERGDNTVTLRITDAAGNASTCAAAVTVQDNINPVAQSKAATIQLNAGGAATLTVADIENGSTDNCAVTVRELSKDGVSGWDTSLIYACGERGDNTVTLRVKDASGNEHTATATVTVQDNISPVALTKPAALTLDNNGSATLNAADIENGSTDNCAVTVWELSKNGSTDWATSLTYACGELGPNTVTLRVKDAAGNSATATATVTVSDLTAPTVISQNISVNLDVNGRATITPAQVNNGSTDNCGTVNLVSVVPSSFTFCDVGPKTVTLTVNDGHGNIAQGTATVTVGAPVQPGTPGVDWIARDGTRDWFCVASSADGTKLVAGEYDDQGWGVATPLYTSTDSGATWTPRGISGLWHSFASSADGTKLIAAGTDGKLVTSTDSGVTWTERAPVWADWYAVASSADGTKLVAAAYWAPVLYTSTDSGVTWTPRGPAGIRWTAVASSADGTKLVATSGDPTRIYTSTDSGVTWILRKSDYNWWWGVASSADGTKLVAVADGKRIYTSTDSGATWTARESSRAWRAVASSADGTKLVATVQGGKVYTSTDSGLTWISRASSRTWFGVASSADGNKLVAAAYGGQIYTSQAANIPAVPAVAYVDDDYGTSCAEVTFPATGGTGAYYVGYNAFKTVQAAINAVAPGGTVRVAAGTYAENVNATAKTLTMAPGGSPAQVTINGDLILGPGNTLAFELNGVTPGTDYDQLVVNGAVTLGGATLSANTGFAYADCATLTLMVNDGTDPAGGTFAGSTNGAVVTVGGQSFKIFYDGADGNDVVLVKDTTAPTITGPADIARDNDPGVCGAVVTYTVESADNCSGQTVAQTAGLASGATFPVGTTVNTFVVTDAGRNTATWSFNVTVNDIQAPTITSPGNLTVNSDAGICTASGVALGTPAVVENCSVASLVNNAPVAFPLGDTTVTWTVTDSAGLTATCQQVVTVVDNQPPTVICQNISVNLDADGRATITPAQVNNGSTDNCGTVNLVSVAPGSFTFCNVGANTVTLTINDGHGNTAQGTATVTVPAPTGRPAIVYVDDDYGTSCAEVTFPAAGGAGQYYVGYNAFKTVQAAINAVATNGTVNVAAGTYHEQLTITKALTVNGSDGAVLDGTGLAPTWTTGVKIRCGNVTLNNLDVANFTQDGITAYDNIDMPNLHITNCRISNIQPGYWGFGIYVGYESEGFGYAPPHLTSHLDFSGLLIEGNEITNVHSSAIVVQSVTGAPGTLQVKNNHIHDNPSNSGIWIDCARNLLIENNVVAGNKWGIEFSAYAETSGTVNGPYSPKDIIVRGNFITNSTYQGVALYEAWPGTITITGNSIQGNGTGLQNYLTQPVNAASNWWGSVTGPTVASNPGGDGNTIVGLADFSPWLADGTDTQPGVLGFQPNLTPLYYVPSALVFTTQPGGANLGALLAPQPVVEVRGDDGNVAVQYQGPVTISIGVNPDGGVLTGTFTRNAVNGVVSAFDDLRITVGGGSGFKLKAEVAAVPPLNVLSDPFDITNSPTTIASLSPFWIRAGSADFTLEVTGTGFVPTSKIHWNGIERTTAFVSAAKLTTLITAAEVVTPANVPVKVVTPAPGGGTTAELTFRIEAATPNVVFVDDGYVGKSPDDLVDWPYTGSGTHIIGYDAFDTVQEGVNAVAANGTVNVAAGTYLEAVEISGNLTLRGAGSGTIIKGSAAITQNFTFTGWNSLSWEYHPVIWVHDADNVTIEDLVVDGDKQGGAYVPSGSISARYTGVAFDDAGGTIEDAEIKNVMAATLDGGGHHALIAHGDANDNTLIVNRVSIHDFGKAGAFFSAVNQSGGSLDVTMTACTVTGAGATTALAQNGIEIEEGATGTISGNTVSEIAWIGSGWTGTGIAAVYSGAVTVSGNTLNNAQSGIALWGAADGSSVAGNTIGANNLVGPTPDIGILLLEVGDVTIGAGNTIDGTGYGWGLYLQDVLATSPLSLGDLAFANFASGNYITLDGIAPALDATGVSFEGKTGSTMTLAECFAAEDRITHQLDDASLELVRWKSGNLYVTTSSGSIQRGIDAAAVGDTVNVATGTYAPFTVNNSVTVAGEDRVSTIVDAGGAAVGVNLSAGNSTLKGFTIQNASLRGIQNQAFGIAGVRIENNIIQNSPTAVYFNNGGAALDNLQIVGCTIRNNGTPTLGMGGIYLSGPATPTPTTAFNNLLIRDNLIEDNYGHGVMVEGTLDTQIINNTVRRSQLGGDIGASGGVNIGLFWSANGLIDGNTSSDAGRQGIALYFASQSTVQNNDVLASAVAAVYLRYKVAGYTGACLVRSNLVAGCVDGFQLRNSHDDAVVRYNSITSCTGRGIYNLNSAGSTLMAEMNWWGSATGPAHASNPGGNGTAIANFYAGNLTDFSPWLGDGTDTQPGVTGFQPNLAPVYYTPHHLVFSTQPGGAGINAPLTPQPVVQVIDENSTLATAFNGSVTLAINTGTAGAAMSTTLTQPVVGGVATFSGLQIDRAGTYTLSAASASPIISATSSSFDIANSLPSIASLSPPWAVAGDAGFTLTVNGADFVYNSVVRWNGSDRPTGFVNSGQLTATITAADIAAIGTANVTVFNVAPGGGESTPATSFEIKSVPAVVWVDDSYSSGGGNDGHLWGYDAFSTIQAGANRVAVGGTVIVAAGTYSEAITLTGKFVNLVGAIDESGSPLPTILGSLYLDYLGSDPATRIQNIRFMVDAADCLTLKNVDGGLTVSNCVFDGAAKFLSGKNGMAHVSGPNGNNHITVDGCVFSNGLYVAISSRYSNFTLKNSLIENVKGGINQMGANDVVVENSVIGVVAQAAGSDTYGIRFAESGTAAENLTVTGCRISVDRNGLTANPGTYHAAVIIRSAAIGTLAVSNSAVDGEVVNLSATGLNVSGNWWGTISESAIDALTLGTGPVDFTPYLNVGTDGNPGRGFQGDFSTLHVTALGAQTGPAGRVQEGHNLATTGGTVLVEAGTYTEVGQVVISKNLSIVGADKLTTIIKPDSDTGTDGDARGWFLIGAGQTFNLQQVTLDGTGHQVYHGLRHHGSGTILDCAFAGIRHGVFEGTAIAAYGPGNIDVTGCTFANIGRNGVATYDAPTGVYSGNTYTGKGIGNWMDYAFLIQWGASVTVQNNVISDCVGVYTQGASSWGSSGIAVWDDPDTTAVLTGNALNNNSVGLAVAVISGTDWGTGLEPVVNIGAGNTFVGGEVGVDVENVGVTAASPAITFGASTFKGQSSQAISFQTGMSEGISYDISSVVFKDNSDVVITDNFAREDLVYHVVDAYDRGLLVWNASKDYVTPLSGSIQRGVDAASAGWTVNVKTGTYVENVNVNQALAVSLGASPAQVIVNGDWAMTSGSSFVMELNGTAPGADHDQLVVNGTVNLGGATLSATSAFSYAAGANVILIANDGTDAVTGAFAGLPSGSTLTLGGQQFTIYYNGGDGNDVALFRSGDLGTYATVYVDDTFPNPVPGQDPDAGGPAQYFMYDSFPTVQGGVNAVTSGGTVNVAAGSYTENVTVNQAVALKGANFGVAGCTGRGAESTIAGGLGTALTIASDDVTVDGFAMTGVIGISARNHLGVAVQNNQVTVVAVGIDAGTFATTALKNVSLAGNCITLAGQLAGSTPTVGLALTGVSGAQAPVLSGNTISGAFYGYLLYAVQADVPTVVFGGTVTGVKQGVAVINVDPQTGTVYLPSTFTVDGVNFTGFTGDHPASPANNFHAGVYVFTGGSDTAAKITGTVKNVSVAGTGKIGADCAGLYFGDFSTAAGGMQHIAVETSTINNNLNRGIYARGAHATVSITQSQIANNGSDPYGTGGNHGFGVMVRQGATVTVKETFVANPASVAAPYTVNAVSADTGSSLTVSNCSVDANGTTSHYLATGTLNASGNWWGGTSAATIASLMSGTVDFTPYLHTGTDVGGDPANGFQGDVGTLHATALGSQTGSTGRVQEAIGAVTSGGNVMVEAGTYAEHVAVNKQVTLAGASPATTTINGGGSGVVVLVTVANSTVTGFTVTGSGSTALDGGIGLINVTGCSVSNNIVSANAAGIGVVGGSGNQVAGNQVAGNYIGITLENRAAFGGTVNDGATGNTIVNNTVAANVLHGINLPENCDNNVVAGNTVTGNGGSGIYLWKADSITVVGNTVTGSGLNNIELMTSLNSTVISNTVSGSPYGVRIRSGVVSSAGNAINYNTLSANTVGIAIEGTATVKGNATLSGGIGVLVSGATTRALLENNSLINDIVAGIKVELGALVDAGDCTGGNVTGLGTGSGTTGSSAGGNTFTGYSVSVPAILNANAGGTPAVLGYQNAYGITAGTSLASVLSGNVLASQSGGLLVTPALPPITVECVGDVPAAVNTLAAFEGLGGAVSATVSVTVSSSDGSLTPGPTEGTITRTYTLTDVCGQTTTSTQIITVNDTIAPLANAGSIAVCYTTVGAAEAAAIAATTVSDNCTATPSITKTASTAGLDPAIVTVTVSDQGGNSTNVSYTTRLDNTAPVIASTAATQFAANVKNGAATVLQGTSANAVQITVVASDVHLVVPPTVALVNGASNEVAVFDSQSQVGTFNYHWDVTPATANGTWTATVTASDLCNDTTDVFTLDLNKTEIVGTVQLEGFVGNVTNRSRAVTFVATTNSPTVTNVVATWSVTLTNASGDQFAYRLTGVPAGTTGLSAKTDWHLRRRLPAALDVNGQAVVDFSGIGGFLKAGDIAHAGVSGNAVVLDDYTTLVGVWFGSDPVADINGDGIVNVFDYALLSFNWYSSGDPQ